MTDWGAFNLFIMTVAVIVISAWALGRIEKKKREDAEE